MNLNKPSMLERHEMICGSVRDLDENGPVEEVESEKSEGEEKPGPPLQVAGPEAPERGGGEGEGGGGELRLQRTAG